VTGGVWFVLQLQPGHDQPAKLTDELKGKVERIDDKIDRLNSRVDKIERQLEIVIGRGGLFPSPAALDRLPSSACP
jgi:hypothetical protein